MDHLQTEARNPASDELDRLNTLQFVRLMNAEDAQVIPAIASQAEVIAQVILVISERLRVGGRLVYLGAGTSGRLGVLDASECPPTFNAPPGQVMGVIAGGPTALTTAVEGAEDDPEQGVMDLESIQFSARDVLVGIATSGRTPYVIGAIDHARTLGAFTIGLSCNADSALIPRVDLAITPVVGPEVITGSTRLKAGTATKLVLNMLSTGAMVRLGKTFGNLMVDLRATNEKLRARTNRIIREATGLNYREADALLVRCDSELKTALVSYLAQVSPEEARRRLEATSGRVRPAIGTPKPSISSDPSTEQMGDFILGIDGGGTRTVALLARPDTEGGWRILGRGESGPSNRQAVGTDFALRAVDAAIVQAFTRAGIRRQPVRAVCLGLAGAGRRDDQNLINEWAARIRLAKSVRVVGDVELLLAAGTPEGWGVAVVAGTGSMAHARGPDGTTARAGGWGYLIGDEGSGYSLALSGLRAVARAADGRGPETELTARFLDACDLTRPEELVPLVYRNSDRTTIAGFAPILLEAAEDGDSVAGEIVRDAANELALAVDAAVRSLGLTTFPLAVSGGLLVTSDFYREQFLTALGALNLTASAVVVVSEPADGAVSIAAASLVPSVAVVS